VPEYCRTSLKKPKKQKPLNYEFYQKSVRKSKKKRAKAPLNRSNSDSTLERKYLRMFMTNKRDQVMTKYPSGSISSSGYRQRSIFINPTAGSMSDSKVALKKPHYNHEGLMTPMGWKSHPSRILMPKFSYEFDHLRSSFRTQVQSNRELRDSKSICHLDCTKMNSDAGD